MSITPEKLRAVKTIITHDNCPDGTASAIILRDVLPSTVVRFLQYGSDAYQNLQAEPGMLFCDFSPPAERVQEFVDAGALVLDHHKTARPVVEAFGENGIFADEALEPGVCGATLAYRHVWCPLIARPSLVTNFVEHFAKLAGIRDTWQKQDPEWEQACIQAQVLRFVPNERWLETSLSKIHGSWKEQFEWIGDLLQEKLHHDVKKMAAKGWSFHCAPRGDKSRKGLHVVVIPSTALTSDVNEYLANTDVDLLVGFSYTFEPDATNLTEGRITLNLSMRSKGYDCSALCKRFGGGGHTRAAGMALPVSPTSDNPYTSIWSLLHAHEEFMAVQEVQPV